MEFKIIVGAHEVRVSEFYPGRENSTWLAEFPDYGFWEETPSLQSAIRASFHLINLAISEIGFIDSLEPFPWEYIGDNDF